MISATGRALHVGKAQASNRFKLFVEDAMFDREVCMHLGVAIEGPGNSDISTKNFGNGTIQVDYRVERPGPYDIHVTFQDQHIQGSPFKLIVK